MSCLPSAPKLSAVLEDLSEESDSIYLCKNDGTVNPPDIERDKQLFTDAVHYCMVLLRQSNRFTSQKSEVLSLEATLMGHEMFERIIGINVQMDVESEDESPAYSGLEVRVKQEPQNDYEETPETPETPETVTFNELEFQTTIKTEKEEEATLATTPVKESGMKTRSRSISSRLSPAAGRMVVDIPRDTMEDFLRHSKTLSPEIAASNVDDKQLPPSPVSLSGSDYSSDISYKVKPTRRYSSKNVIPLDMKERAVKLARLNPTWSLPTLRKQARAPYLNSVAQLGKWEKQVDGGGTMHDKRCTINSLTYERFLAARAKSQPVNIDMLRQWGLKAAKDVYGSKFKFEASGSWAMTFKRIYKLHWDNSNGYCLKNEKKVIQAARLAEKKKRTSKAGGRISAGKK